VGSQPIFREKPLTPFQGEKMKANKLVKSKKAVSPVIATVILVSVTIVVAVAVAYWMGGIAGIYTRVEKIEIMDSVATRDDDNSRWLIDMNLKNSGSADATVQSVRINAKALGLTAYYVGNVTDPVTFDPNGLTILAGQEESLTFTLKYFDDDPASLDYAPTNPVAGADIEVKLHTAAGMDYPDWVTLP